MARTTDRLPSPYRPELDIVNDRLKRVTQHLNWPGIQTMATPWVNAVRENPPPFWAMESLLKEYPISSAEGLALMRLAEALLRVPDAETAIALTSDQLGRANFEGAADSTLARLSSAAISLSKHFLPQAGSKPGLLSKLGSRTVVAATLRAVQLLGRQFVLGQNIQEGLQEAQTARKKMTALRPSAPTPLTFSYDMLGEGARTQADAERYWQSYRHAIECISKSAQTGVHPSQNDGISIKLSALHPRYEDGQHERVMTELVPRVWTLCQMAAQANISLTIDAEEVDRLELSLDVFEALVKSVAQHHPQWEGLGLAMQAYQTRAVELIEHIGGLAQHYGLRLMCRLVKGAYWDAEIKRAQELGLSHYPVYTHKHHTDISYLACARTLLQFSSVIFAQFATHNAATIAAILQMAAPLQAASPAPIFELQRLHGMGEGVYREVLSNTNVGCRVYAPVGAHRDLLAYLVRRLLENGANSSFVHQLADESVGMDQLLSSPLHAETQAALPLPRQLYGSDRINSRGRDLAVVAQRDALLQAHALCRVDPVEQASPEQIQQASSAALNAFPSWNALSPSARADILLRSAQALEDQQEAFCALLVREAQKVWSDAISEVREAIDFLRYYAAQAQHLMGDQVLTGPTGESNTLRLSGRGPWVCISPWNFPLAIFVGQISAALVTGNTVLAKPAEQTPAVALAMVQLMHECGVPQHALQLLHGPGESVGAALVALPHIAGVVFTGSTQVAKIIQRALAAKDGAIVPFIAETGGINAMVVDSSALPEQVSDAVMQSAFRSAGQRCSALRLLCVHEAVADAMIEMIQGAALELQCANSQHLSTDVGPLIDAEAHQNIAKQIQRLQQNAKNLLPGFKSACTNTANLLTPHLFEIQSLDELGQEIFGPVLHVLRWSGDPITMIERINSLGYGLTLGIQTRIDSRALAMAQAARIGNVYINRNMIGAVVGVQPFGGEGLSGTGPKAGGPHYLLRFCAEQTLTINTTAAGGNVSLFVN